MKASARAVFAVLVLLGVVLLLEVSSRVAWRLTEGAAFSYREAAALRARQAAAARSGEPVAEAAAGAAGDPAAEFQWLPGHLGGMVIHPFLGFVYSPEYNQLEGRSMTSLVVADSGFFVPRAPAPPASARPLRIGVFGGSVAMVFAFQGERALLDRLGGAVGPRGAVIESYGLGGYKQPQQLMTLAWLLARGEAPDVMVNLDGFNEIALPRTENLPQGINPFYPRAWERRVRAAPDPHRELLEGEVAYLGNRRAEIAAAFDRAGLGWSVTWNFVWRWLDRRAAAEAAGAQLRLAAYRPADHPWVAHGPAYRVRGSGKLVADLVAMWERSSLAMHHMAEGAGLRYYHFLQPNQYLPASKPLAPRELEIAYKPRNHYREPVEQGYPALREAGRRLAAQGVAFHDLTQLFADERRAVYNDDCCHLNLLGNELVAGAIAEAVAADLAGEGAAAESGAAAAAGAK